MTTATKVPNVVPCASRAGVRQGTCGLDPLGMMSDADAWRELEINYDLEIL